MRRAAAYYGLGEFTKAIEDSRQALSIAPHSVLTPNIYRTIILSYLQFGSVEDASKAALEWEKETGDPAASEVHRIVEENQTSPQRALMLLRRR
jgi:hypothetical protein